MLFSVYSFLVFSFFYILAFILAWVAVSKKGLGGGGGEKNACLSPIPLSFPFPSISFDVSAM